MRSMANITAALTANAALSTNAGWDPKKDFAGLGAAAWTIPAVVVPAASSVSSVPISNLPHHVLTTG